MKLPKSSLSIRPDGTTSYLGHSKRVTMTRYTFKTMLKQTRYIFRTLSKQKLTTKKLQYADSLPRATVGGGRDVSTDTFCNLMVTNNSTTYSTKTSEEQLPPALTAVSPTTLRKSVLLENGTGPLNVE
jgi:hypothetical protein